MVNLDMVGCTKTLNSWKVLLKNARKTTY